MDFRKKIKLYVGVDVHSRFHTVALLPTSLIENGEITKEKVRFIQIRNSLSDFNLLNEEVRTLVVDPNEVAFVVDATGHYSEPITYFLLKNGYPVYYLESKGVKTARKGILDQENKSDAIDSTSFALLRYLSDRLGLSFRITSKNAELFSASSVIKSQLTHRDQYVKLLTQTTNRLHQFLLVVFPEGEATCFRYLIKITDKYPTPRDILSSDDFFEERRIPFEQLQLIYNLAKNTVGVPGDTYRWLIMELSIQRKYYMIKENEITKAIKSNVNSHPYTPILLSFPAIGNISAAQLIGAINDVSRFSNAKKFRKAMGVYARFSQSGNSPVRSGAGKEGNRYVKKILFMACLSHARTTTPDNDFGNYYRYLIKRGMVTKKAIAATMGKMAEVIYHCLIKGEKYEYRRLHIEYAKQPSKSDNK